MSQSEDWHRLWERLSLRLPREPLEGVLSFQALARPRFLLDEPNVPGCCLHSDTKPIRYMRYHIAENPLASQKVPSEVL